MDRRIYDVAGDVRGPLVTIEMDGHQLRAHAGEPLAVALFAGGVRVFGRSLKYHRPRSFFCLRGHCSGCLVRVDGLPNVRSCQLACGDGMVASGQNAYPSSEHDLLGAVDWFFPRGMNQHTLMTGSRLLNGAMQKIVRKLSGLGTLPERAAPELPEVGHASYDVIVVGGGPAGLAAATASAHGGARTLCIDDQATPGGSLLAWPGGVATAAAAVNTALMTGVDLWARSTALSWFPEDDGGVLAVATPDRLWRLQARRFIYSTGGYDVNLAFENNDRPGVIAARAAGLLALLHGVRPGEQVVLAATAGGEDYARKLCVALFARGVVATVIDAGHLRRANGGNWVESVDLVDNDGKHSTIACDLLAIATAPAPASETARAHGARVVLDPAEGGFAVITDPDGHTSVPSVLACGDVTGFRGPDGAAEHGAWVGVVAAIESLDTPAAQVGE